MVMACHLVGQPLLFNRHVKTFWTRLFEMGWCGVDLFFILSGFLLASILLGNLDSPSYYRTFYLRRAFRILPPCALLAFLGEPLFRSLGEHHTAWYAYLFTTDFALLFGTVWVGMSHLWSLAVEEQFYLILPAILRWRNGLLPFIALAATCFAPFIRCFEWARFGTAGVEFLPFGRMDTMFAGAFIAWLFRYRSDVIEKIRPCIPWTIAAISGTLLLLVALGWTTKFFRTCFWNTPFCRCFSPVW